MDNFSPNLWFGIVAMIPVPVFLFLFSGLL